MFFNKKMTGLLATLFLTLPLFCQTKTVPGYFVNNQNQKFVGKFEIPVQYLVARPNFEILQWHLYMRKNKKECYVLTPDNIRAFSFEYKGESYRFKSTKNWLGLHNPFKKSEERIFVRTEVQGTVSLFRIIARHKDSERYTREDQYLLKDGEMILLKKWGLQRQLKKIFADYQPFVELLEDTKFKQKNIPEIIRYFNTNFDEVARI